MCPNRVPPDVDQWGHVQPIERRTDPYLHREGSDELLASRTSSEDRAPKRGTHATTDQWCVNAQFGSAIKVGYKTPDGTTVTFAADQYVLQNPNASCSVSGPSAGQLTCGTHISKSTYDDSYATFVVAGKGVVGSPPPPETTISCASLQDRGRDGGLVTGDLCSGVVGFNGTARLKGHDPNDGERSYDCAEVRVTLERSADGSTYRAARGTRCQLV